MAELEKTFIIAARHDAVVPADWQQQLSQKAGLTIIGALARRAQVRGQPETVRAAAAALGPDFLVEEILPRNG